MKTYTMLVVFDRCKDLEQQDCSLAALKNVGIQAVVTEFLISHADILFTDSFMNRRREHTYSRSILLYNCRCFCLCTFDVLAFTWFVSHECRLAFDLLT